MTKIQHILSSHHLHAFPADIAALALCGAWLAATTLLLPQRGPTVWSPRQDCLLQSIPKSHHGFHHTAALLSVYLDTGQTAWIW